MPGGKQSDQTDQFVSDNTEEYSASSAINSRDAEFAAELGVVRTQMLVLSDEIAWLTSAATKLVGIEQKSVEYGSK